MITKFPYPYYGSKRRVASEVWKRFGDVRTYIEPFFGGGSVLLSRPYTSRSHREIVNDLDGYVSNFWRAIRYDAATVAEWADHPIIECDLHAWSDRLREIVRDTDIFERLRNDPEFYDAKLAGVWVWIMSTQFEPACFVNGKKGMPYMAYQGKGVNSASYDIPTEIEKLGERLRRVKVLNGDWSRCLSSAVMADYEGTVGVFLDPPYSAADRDMTLYANDGVGAANDLIEWCKANGANPNLRIAYCDYAGQTELEGWTLYRWKTAGGMGRTRRKKTNEEGDDVRIKNENGSRECIWFSPHCLKEDILF